MLALKILSSIIVLAVIGLLLLMRKKPVMESEPDDGSNVNNPTNSASVVEKLTKLPAWLKDILIGTGIVLFTVTWLWWTGPDICAWLFHIEVDANAVGVWKYPMWLYFVSNLICIIAGPMLYCLFVPSLKTNKGGIGFTLLIIIFVIIHSVQLYWNKKQHNDSFATNGQSIARDYIDCPRGSEPTFRLKAGEYSPYMHSTYNNANIDFQSSKSSNYKVCYRDGECYQKGNTPKYKLGDFRYFAVTDCYVRAVFQ
jgi:preprotein translocase subunit SecG